VGWLRFWRRRDLGSYCPSMIGRHGW
jgi:hypothetical protein